MTTTETKTSDFWSLLENVPHYAKATGELVQWSLNYDVRDESNPLHIFLDLIGWSENELGVHYTTQIPVYGFIELAHIADALNEYTTSPEDVYNWLTELLEADR